MAKPSISIRAIEIPWQTVNVNKPDGNYGKSPFLMGKSQFLMGKSSFLMGKSPFLMGKSPLTSILREISMFRTSNTLLTSLLIAALRA